MARPHPHNRAARLAAISILTLIGAVALIWAAPRMSGAVAAWATTPSVKLRTASLPRDLPVAAGPATSEARTASLEGPEAATMATVDAGMKFTMAGVQCAPSARTAAVVVLLRTSEDGQTWGRWHQAGLELAAEEGGEERAFTEPVWTGGGRYLQVAARAAGTDEDVPVRLRDVRVVAINSTEDADRAAAVAGVLRRAVASIAGLRLATEAAAMTTRPQIVTRAEWGANESWRSGTPDYAAVKMAFVHHTAGGNGYSAAEAPAVVRGVYAYHTRSLHWSDVGYNFLIDRYGTIYEGRAGGMAKGVVGAQVLGFNTGSTGVCLMGTFSDSTPTSRSVTALERLLEWKLDVHHVDPQGTGTLTCAVGQKYRTGQRVTFPAIAGHRDANFTECPGGRLYAQLPEVRKVVARRGQPKIYGFVVGHPAISPNGDGVRDRTTIGFTVSQPAAWSVEIRDDGDRPVWRTTGEGTDVELTWAGRGGDGDALPDGVYTVRADATSADGVARSATDTVQIDTVAPRIESASVAPNPFSPNGDGHGDRSTVTFVPGESGTARVSVVAGDGSAIRRLTGWESVTATAKKVAWDGRVTGGSGLEPASEGPSGLLVETRDRAGNATSVTRSVTVDRTLSLTGLSRKVFSPNGDGAGDTVVVSFRLTRAADVTAKVTRPGSALRTIRLGRLAAGAHSVAWDGTLDDGGAVTSGACAFRVTATGSLGATSAAPPATVDLTRPRVTAPASVTVKYGRTARVAYLVRDAYSPTVKVGVTVTGAAGRVIVRQTLGWVRQGVSHGWVWRPKARRTYTVTFTALDLGGNRQASPVLTKLRVR